MGLFIKIAQKSNNVDYSKFTSHIQAFINCEWPTLYIFAEWTGNKHLYIHCVNPYWEAQGGTKNDWEMVV